MSDIWYVIPLGLGCEAVGILIGLFLGQRHAEGEVQREHDAAMKMLAELLGAAEHLASNIDTHDSEIRAKVQEVGNLHVTAELETVKQILLGKMTSLLESNQHMQEDLLCTRYRLEEQAVQIDRALHEARTDELTNLNNRRAFREKLHLLLAVWRRQQAPFVLILADLDQFKWVNDAHGHAVGDRMLKTLGVQLKQWMRPGDFASRYGGDEFAVLLPNTSLDDGQTIAEEIRRRISDKTCSIAVRGGEVSLSASFGVTAPRVDDTDDSIFERADQNMYRSKHRGRNHVEREEGDAEETTSLTGGAASY
jgi:diguanylate cyclase